MAVHLEPFRLYRPAALLAEFVDFFWLYEGYDALHDRERVLPTGTTELVFTTRADGTLGCGIAGPRSQCLLLDTSASFSVIAVHFKPGGGFPFFGVPAGDMRNTSVPLDLVWGGYTGIVGGRLWEARCDAHRFAVLEEARPRICATASRAHTSLRKSKMTWKWFQNLWRVAADGAPRRARSGLPRWSAFGASTRWGCRRRGPAAGF